MARRVKTTSAVRSCRTDLNVREFCDDNGLLDKYDFAIRRTLDSWNGDLDVDETDKLVMLALTKALKGAEWLEDDLKARFDLPPGWAADEKNWDQYREAIAVTVLQAYYDSVS